jgi:phage terminase small subunit
MLTERQKAFVSAYAGPGTGLAAARAAGYTGADATLRVAASRLLRVPAVIAALEDRLALPASTASTTDAPKKLAAPKRPKDDPRIAGHIEQQRILTSIARSEEEGSEVRIKAVAALAKIQATAAAAKAHISILPSRPRSMTPERSLSVPASAHRMSGADTRSVLASTVAMVISSMRHLAAGVMNIPREFNFHSRSLVFGIAGAAILLATSKRSAGGKVLAKGAAGGFLACLLMKRVNVGMGCTAAGIAGGYVVARMWR